MLAKYTIAFTILAIGLLLSAAGPSGDHLINGAVVKVNQKGDTVYLGNYKRNKLHGRWTSWYPNRQVCDSGTLDNAMADGVWKVWYPDGKLRYQVHFSARKLHALKDEILRKPKNRYYMLSGLPASDAARHYNARIIFGHQLLAQKKLILSGQINHDLYGPDALETIVERNAEAGGTIYYSPFSEGLPHGNYESWNPDGSIKEQGVYINGLREGVWELYRKDLTKCIGGYRHGKPFGEWRYYNPGGKLLFMKRYDLKGQVVEHHDFIAP